MLQSRSKRRGFRVPGADRSFLLAFNRTVIVSIIRLQSIILFLKDDDGDITFQTTKLAIWW